MHVGLDLLFLVPGQTGGRETYARGLVPALRAARPDWRLTAFVAREAAGGGWWTEPVDDVAVLRAASGRARGRWALGELALLPRAARGLDVLHALANFAPVAAPCPRVVTVHDAIWLREPDTVPAPVRALTTALVRPAARRAARVLTPSAASRDDLVRLLGVPAERVEVVPNGIAPPGRGDAARGRALAGAGASRPIVLCVATNVAHKNLPALLAAAGSLPAGERPLVVLAGHGTEALGGADVRALGARSPAELEDLYAAAAALVLPTRYEGFGLPVVEALARGVPVACSDVAVLREVAGDAARFFDPSSPPAIAEAMRELLAGGEEVERRVAAGRERARRFTWEAAAEAVARTYEAVAR